VIFRFRSFGAYNGYQMSVINSGVSGPKFTKFLCDGERTPAVLMRLSALPSCHLLRNVSPKKEGVSWISAEIGCYDNVP